MKHKLIAIICAVSLLFTGCQLAREDMSTNANEDYIVGMFITTEYLDLFDFEGYLNANIKGFGGGEINIDNADAEKYQGRIYATLKEISLTNEETGEDISHWDYVFEGLDGSSCFVAEVTPPTGGTPYIASVLDGVISDSGTHIYSGGDEERREVSATLYVSPSATERTYYLNPVYQSADGSVYLESGSGFTIGDWNTSEGMQYAQSLEGKTTITENGKQKTRTARVELTISIAYENERIKLIQMDASNEIVSVDELNPNELAQSFMPAPSTQYIIAETHKRNSKNELIITREIYEKDDTDIQSLAAQDNGILQMQQTRIEW